MKKKIIIGNWKLNGNKKEIKNKIKNLIKKIKNKKNEISIAPPIIYLLYTKILLKNNKYITLTSQNIDINLKGSFTGDISGLMLKDIGTKYVIIGHSERKIYHKEKMEIIKKKLIISKQLNIIPILCIGENEKEYNEKKSENICSKQIKYFINKKNYSLLNDIIIAYEPIWAIGTGKNATIDHIYKIYKCIYKIIYKKTKNTKFIYGGSINKKNANNIIKNKFIDGLLIGNTSLNINDFTKIINN